MEILIDNGHGENTAGKRSPDGLHREYLWARMFAERLEKAIALSIGTKCHVRRIVPENRDILIGERVRRVNAICKELGAKNVLLLSIHNNAAGNGSQWHDARGFSSHISLNASVRSQTLATCIAHAVHEEGIKTRKPKPEQWYWPQNLGICRDTNCAAVLTENLFQDNREDVNLLHDEAFLNKLCLAYVKGIENYIKIYGS